ncbi:sugar phosphate nucleotidyltransferase [Clostridium chauvoei]|uniref:NTP transferase domain-containing protein n=2 Tax=Clostridium chauvoei TaxID=46867 RepID=A0ABD4REZ9_9CLOT|nr:sugar phosphate nucleotidyltransferase [Clostridium chauvoei]ATD54293.1 CTP--phosphocholine cytidylyltransferase [Clostridium chauvoei]ATD58024.1 CTP--phosphocholine cytidylyltransferase [Clostridium chauvoei]MBX7279899.1 NTP transferase domain-containing protein [Clostridium chauvoei]MBX7282183.1 NTP transferase domain-containing protein [Clostridium chauvoei]MBX7284789.1 NTP transferase domain-containing protein [Clostridium chauvoei]
MRAILLAAGMGTRLRPLTLDTPKSLIKVNGMPLAERQIQFLKEKGIDEIIIVTGYLNEKFEYLKNKYGVTLVYNDKYNVYNNIYTMFLVREFLKDSYVIDADVYINRNFLLEKPKTSTYFSAYKKDVKNEWKIIFDENNKVSDIEVMDGQGEGHILSGVSYWSKKDAEVIIKDLERVIENEDFSNFYWDDIVKDNIKKLDLYINKIEEDDIFEIDSIEDLEYVKKRL